MDTQILLRCGVGRKPLPFLALPFPSPFLAYMARNCEGLSLNKGGDNGEKRTKSRNT